MSEAHAKWREVAIQRKDERGRMLRLRGAVPTDIPTLERWDHEPHVISASTDDPDADIAFGGIVWPDELAGQDEFDRYYIGELGEADDTWRPIGAMQIADPHNEKSHYWGEIEPNLRAVDIWIGDAKDHGHGFGEQMMRMAFRLSFDDPSVTAIVIDPLSSNTRAHKFYQRLGFKPTHRQTFGDDDSLVHKLTRADWRKLFPGD